LAEKELIVFKEERVLTEPAESNEHELQQLVDHRNKQLELTEKVLDLMKKKEKTFRDYFLAVNSD
jgi:hypothetical protein